MKAKVTRGSGFRGVLNYSFGAGKKNRPDRARIVGGNMSGKTPRELAAEFSVSRRQRPEVKKPVWHCSLALPQGEQLDDATWHRLCERHLQNMGFDTSKHMWVAVRHDDTDYDHVHIIASRIGLDGALWLGQFEAKRAIESTQQLEREFGLRITPGLNSEPEHQGQTRGEAAKKERTGQASVKKRMQCILNKAMQAGSFQAFVKACQADGLELLPNVASTGKMNGFSFRLSGEVMKASDLGSKYRWAKLAVKIGFDPARHMSLIQQLAGSAKVHEAAEPATIFAAAMVANIEQRVRRNRTIDLLFIRLDDGTYTWKKSQAVAFCDLGDRIRLDRTPEAVVKAALQLAREKGWAEVEATGSIEFQRRAWLQGQLLGIKVDGYKPSIDDITALASRRRDAAIQIVRKEGDPLIRQILILKAESEAKLAVHRALYEEIPTADIEGDTLRSDQQEFVQRHADDAYLDAKRQALASRSVLKKVQVDGFLSKLRQRSVVHTKFENDRRAWAAYLAHCQRILSSASADRIKLVLEVADMEFWVREIRAGRMPTELLDAIERRRGTKLHAAAAVNGINCERPAKRDHSVNGSKHHDYLEARHDHSLTSEPEPSRPEQRLR